MRIAVVHGYFLHDSGSGVYVRELTRALTRLGHDVTLVCQEREPERYGFIDSAYVLDSTNESLTRTYATSSSTPGTCKLVRPHIGDELLVYAEGKFPPFKRERTYAFQNATAQSRDRYVNRNVQALRTVFAAWPPDLVLAQHVIMQPFEVHEALAKRAPYIVTSHGSALNFSVRTDDALAPFALTGLANAQHVATVSGSAREEIIEWAAEHGLGIAEKTVAIPPGINTDLFRPSESRDAAVTALREHVALPEGLVPDSDDDIIAFASGLHATKGLHHAIAALPIVSQLRGRPVRLLVAGKGPAREPLGQLASLLEAGDDDAARHLVRSEPLLQSPPLWGDVIPDALPQEGRGTAAFLGQLDHGRLAAVFAAADVCVSPSVFPEAAALVNIEALSAGAIPIASYHSGMTDLGDLLASELDDARLRELTPGPAFTQRLAETIAHVLGAYPTKSHDHRQRMHALVKGNYPTWEQAAHRYVEMVS